MPSVFLSYSRVDQAIARKFVAALESSGCSVWWDAMLEGGERFSKTTEAALDGADVVVVLWSKTSVNSHWVHDEATRGRDRGRLVPVSIDGSFPPLGFGQFQALDFSKWKGKPNAAQFEPLVRAIGLSAGQEAIPAFAATGPANPSRRGLIIGGSAALAVAGGGVALWKSGLFASGVAGNSVAVLSFRNLSGDAGQDYFAEGLAEEIRTALSRNSKLRVLAPESSAAAKPEAGNSMAIASQLGVAFLLTGAVRRSGNVLRISAALAEGATGTIPWRDQFDKPLDDIFKIQGEIADAVAAVMSAQTADDANNPKGMGGTRSTKAYDAYLRGNAYYALGTGESSDRAALAQFNAALDADPLYAEAHGARSRTLIVITNSYAKANEFRSGYDDAIGSARKAVELAPRLASMYSTLGYALLQGNLDIRGAAAAYGKAAKLGPGDAGVQRLTATFLAEMGQEENALSAITRAIELDPLNPSVHRMAAFVHYCARRFEEAMAACRQSLSLNQKLAQAYAYLGDSQFHSGQIAQARESYSKEPSALLRDTGLAIAHHKLGDRNAAEAALSSLMSSMGDAASYQHAQIFAQWGQLDEALSKLAFARKIGDVGLAMAKTDPMLDPLRARPEFSRLLKGLGFS